MLLVLIQHERAGRCFVATASKEAAGVSLTPSKNTRSTRKGLQSNRANAGLLIKNTVHVEKLESVVGLVQKVKTSCALASKNLDSYLLRRDTVLASSAQLSAGRGLLVGRGQRRNLWVLYRVH